MKIQRAVFNDWMGIQSLLMRVSRGKAHPQLCAKRARQLISRGYRADAWCYVASDEDTGKVHGFLFAAERPAFDLVATSFVEVHYLVSDSPDPLAVQLLQTLRDNTSKRILVQSWTFFGRMSAFQRLIRPLRPEKVGETYQL